MYTAAAAAPFPNQPAVPLQSVQPNKSKKDLKLSKDDMAHAIAKGLAIKHDLAVQFIKSMGGDSRAAAAILAWTKETAVVPVRDRAVIERASYVDGMKSWAEKWKIESFLCQATLFELKVTMRENVTYPCIAFKEVKLDACLDFAARMNVIIEPHDLAYAIAHKEIERHKCVTVDAMKLAMARASVAYVDPTELRPFGPDLFEGHILENADINQISLGDVMSLAPGRGVELMREKNMMRNRIVQTRFGFKFREGANEFVCQVFNLLNKDEVEDVVGECMKKN